MKNRSLILGFAVFVGAALIFSGCEQETKTEYTAGATIGAAADLAGLQELLDTDGVNTVTYYGGDLEIGAGTLIIPVGKTVTVDDGGVTLDTTGGLLVVGGTLELPVDEKITGTAGVVVAPAALKAKTASDFPAANFIAIQSGTTIVPAAKFAVSGDITISADATSATNILNTALSSTTDLYVIGSLTVNKPIGQAATVAVLGSATVNDAETGTNAIKWLVSGTLTANKAPTVDSGTIEAETLNVAGAGATIALSGSGTVKVGELVTTGTVTITTGTGGLTAGKVTGAAVFATGAEITEADFAGTTKFAGTATLGDVSFGDDVTITAEAAGKLTLEGDAVFAGNKSIKVGDAAVLTAGDDGGILVGDSSGTTLAYTVNTKVLTVAAQAASIKGAFTVPAGVTLKADSVTLTIDAEASLVLTGAAAAGGAKTDGTIKVAKTTISGIWQAVGTGAVAIAAADANVSVIAASADTVVLTAVASGSGAITQATGANNNLTIAADTTIALGGTDSAKLGTITLTSGTNPGVLTLVGKISGQTGLTTDVTAAEVTITKATLAGTKAITGKTDATNKNLGELIGSASNNTITASATASNDVTLTSKATIKA